MIRTEGRANTGLLAAAAWIGLIVGLAEGPLFFAARLLYRQAVRVNTDILWVAPLVDVTVFVLAAGALLLVARLIRRPPPERTTWFALISMTLVVFISVLSYDRLNPLAVLLLACGLGLRLSSVLGRHAARLGRLFRRTLAPLLVLAVLYGLGVVAAGRVREARAIAGLPENPGAPNVILIILDTVRADHLSTYGYDRETSPQLSALARAGALFSRAYAPASYTLASHGTLLSGLYPQEHGADWSSPMGFHKCGCPVLAQRLRENGYRTAAVSANPFWFTHEHGFDQGFIRFRDYGITPAGKAYQTLVGRIIGDLVLPRLGFEDTPARTRGDRVTREALRWIRSDSEHPFFVTLNYFDAHDPYLTPHPYRDMFAESGAGSGMINWRLHGEDPALTRAQLEGEVAAYDGGIASDDHAVGDLLEALAEEGLADRTLVVVTGDHGEAFGEHGFYLHGHTLYSEEIHVPLLIRFPGHVPAGRVVDRPVTIASIPETVLSLLGLPPLSGKASPALDALWQPGADSLPWPPPLGELSRKPWSLPVFPARHGAMRALMSDRRTLILHETDGPQLYDAEHDPGQAHDLSVDPAETEPLRELSDLLLRRLPYPPSTSEDR